jgi:amino acid transporter
MQIVKNKRIIAGLVLLFFIGCLGLVNAVGAQGFGSASGYLDNMAGRLDLHKGDGLASIIGVIINGVLSFLGVVCLGFIIYAGLRLMMAGGSEETVQAARATIKWALIGLIVVIGAYTLSHYVVSQVLDASKPPLRPEITDEYVDDDEMLGAICEGVNCWSYYDNEIGCITAISDEGRVCCFYNNSTRECESRY